MLEVCIPIKGFSGNHRNSRAKNGHYYNNQKYKDFKEIVGWYIKAWWPKKDLIKGNISAEFTYGFKDNRKHDLDDCNKALWDTLNGLIWEDDNQIDDEHSRKVHSENDFIKIKIL